MKIIRINVALTEREVAVLDHLKKVKSSMTLTEAEASGFGVEYKMLVEKHLVQFGDSYAYSLTYYGLSANTHPEC